MKSTKEVCNRVEVKPEHFAVKNSQMLRPHVGRNVWNCLVHFSVVTVCILLHMYTILYNVMYVYLCKL